ncbi:AHH domain-containing protein [Archangium lipolyticum]|uniref:AHH domain-containing protein n=1 Tax=Archangium lipolyticum TaxID=2970465 RepID=UPI00214A1272|nr:AHH domain-containing protein [Archangium lipolyticum]
MRTPLALPHIAVALLLLLPLSCATTPDEAPGGVRPGAQPRVVRTSELPGGRLRLSFEPVPPDPALERLHVQEARAVLAALYDALPAKEKSRPRLVLASTGTNPDPQWELRLREEYLSRYGPPLLPLPESVENSPLFLALKLSPRYMGEGVREAAAELFRSPVFLASVALSVLVYFAAWLAPEPLFTKAFAATLTVVLALTVGVLELTQLARACVRLYQETQAARTVGELEAAAEHFGRALGGTALRVLMLVASAGVAKGLPQVPKGGLGSLLPPRFALEGGATLVGASEVRMVADGTVLVTGVAAGTAAARAGAAGSACTDGSQKQDGYQWHHLATNKNDSSPLNGGPWTPQVETIFAKAGMSLDAAENLVYLKGHKGPHPEEYHMEVYRRLRSAVAQCRSQPQCRGLLVESLRELADEVCTPGSHLHRLATRRVDG